MRNANHARDDLIQRKSAQLQALLYGASEAIAQDEMTPDMFGNWLWLARDLINEIREAADYKETSNEEKHERSQ